MKQRTKRSGSSSVVSLALTGGIVLFGAGSAAYVLMGDEGAKPAVEHVIAARDAVRNVTTAGPASAVKPTLPAASTPAITPPAPVASAPVLAPAPTAPVTASPVVAASLPVVTSAPAVAPQVVNAASGAQRTAAATPQLAAPVPAVAPPAQVAVAVAHPQPVPSATSPVATLAASVAPVPTVAPTPPASAQPATPVAVPTVQPKQAVTAPQPVAPAPHVATPVAVQAPVVVPPVVPAKPVQKKPKHVKHVERLVVPEPSPEQAQTLAPPKSELLPEAAAAAAAAIAQRDKLRKAAAEAPVAVNPIATEQPSARPIEDRPRKVEAVPAPKAPEAAPSASQYREIHPIVAEPLVSDAKPSVVARSSGGDKAWVRLGSTRTVIVTKGQSVPGLGTFEGADSKGAKFDSGYVPISQ